MAFVMSLYKEKVVTMARRHRGVKVAEHGNLTDEKDIAVICPIRPGSCNSHCAWYSVEARVIRCRDTAIGAIRGKPIRSFRLYLGPQLYDPDELPSSWRSNE